MAEKELIYPVNPIRSTEDIEREVQIVYDCFEHAAEKPVRFLGEAQILREHYIRFPVNYDPFIQSRHANNKIISHQSTRKPTAQRRPHRILTHSSVRFCSIILPLVAVSAINRGGIKLRQGQASYVTVNCPIIPQSSGSRIWQWYI